jgi:hypothetical protein
VLTFSDSRLAGFASAVGMRQTPIAALEVAHRDFSLGLERQLAQASAVSRQTSGLLIWLPWLSLTLGQLGGLGPLRFLIGSWLGLTVLAGAGALTLCASLITRRIIDKAAKLPEDPGLWFDVAAQCLSDGLGVEALIRELRRHVGSVPGVEHSIRESLMTGTPVAASLRAKAKLSRAELQASKQLQITKLPVKLLIPMTGLLLPQFMLLLVLPAIAAALSSH